MSQRDGFASGFFAGALFGSVVGGVLGVLITSRRDGELAEDLEQELTTRPIDAKKASAKRRQMKAIETENMSMEMTRRSLEDKIAQLNATIDEVQKQLGHVNGNSVAGVSERADKSEERR